MKTLHAKSPCCREKTYQHGNKRRQCSLCGKTWTIRSKKRGRKPYRVNKQLLRRILLENRKLAHLISSHYPSLPALRKRFRANLKWLVKQPRNYQLDTGKLILLADGLWFCFDKEKWVLFLIALKPVNANEAILLDPVLLRGRESYDNWRMALNTMPNEVKKRIVAFVSDDFRAANRIVKKHQWIHQLCHFHLIAQLQIRRGKRKTTISGRSIRKKIYQAIRQALIVVDKKQLDYLKYRLKNLACHPDCPRKLQMMVNEFLRKIDSYRAYLLYPELNLPNTTNAVESTGKLVRRITATLNTHKSLYLWSTALIKLRCKITCNGKHFPHN